MKIIKKLLYSNKIIALSLFCITLTVYLVLYTGEQKHLNYFVPLADAFLNGRVYLIDNPSWLNELIEINGKYFVVYPPMPALLLMPFVFLFGVDFQQPLFSILIGAINTVLCFIVVLKVLKSRKVGILISLLYAFGSMQFYHAIIGSAWYIAHIIAMFFIWLAFLSLFREKRNYLITGLLIGAAYWARLPAILAIFFPLLLYRDDFIHIKPRFNVHYKNGLFLFLGVGVFIILNFLYNYVRYGVIYDISYQLLPIFEEPWYQHGLFNIINIPIHLKELLFALPQFSMSFPYMIPSLNVMAIWFVMPAVLLIIFVQIRQRLIWSLILTVLIMSLPGLMHGSNGFTQFGFRFSLDYLPFILLLIGAGIRKKSIYLAVFLISLSILINMWGVIVLTIFKLWTI